MQKVDQESPDLVYVHCWRLQGCWEEQPHCIIFSKSSGISLTPGGNVEGTRQSGKRSLTHPKSIGLITDGYAYN